MFYTWGCLDAPYVHMPPYICMPPGVYTPPYVPILLCAFVCSQRLLHVVGVVRGPLHVRHLLTPHPVWGGLPICLHPHSFVSFPVHQYVSGISVCDMENISLMLGAGGFGGISTWGTHMCTLVVHYVSCFYYSYDYYSSSYGGVFWAIICFISDHGSFPEGASYNIGSAWSGSTTTLGAEKLWRCYWPCLCATAATSIFDASSGLCQLCYGFSTGRFLCQSWASHHFVHVGVCSGVCFLLLDAKLDAIFTYGGSTIRVCTFATLWSLPMASICATWWWSLVHAWHA